MAVRERSRDKKKLDKIYVSQIKIAIKNLNLNIFSTKVVAVVVAVRIIKKENLITFIKLKIKLNPLKKC